MAGQTHGRAPSCGTAASVLVVDDNDDLRFLLRQVFEIHDRFEVVGEAADGEQALRRAVELQPDVIILDLMMPRLDGRAALPTLARDCPAAMIVVLSALDAGDAEQAVLGQGAFAFEEKHRVSGRLAEVTADHLERFRRGADGAGAADDGPPPGG